MNKLATKTINSRVLTHKPNLSIDKNKNYLFDLSYLGILDLQGEKAAEFLQGQITCDVKQVTNTHMAQGLQCNLQGRILSKMDVFFWNGLKILLPKDLLTATQKSLTKPALLSKVTILENTEFMIFGFYLQNPKDLILDCMDPRSIELLSLEGSMHGTDDYCIYHLGAGFYICITRNDISNQFVEKDQFLGSYDWHSLRLEHKNIDIYPESKGLFLPHRLGLHTSGLISFNKGCYKGQEIIARTHYRATIKHELRLIELVGEVFSGQVLIHSETGLEVGEVVDYTRMNDDKYLVAASVLKESDSSTLLCRLGLGS
ncbi:MAG: folate-binding protein YgfZ [Legionella sp.]|jgi:hypothetical protein